MPPPKRMTANPIRPARHRPGKPGAPVEQSSSEEEDSDDEQDEETAPNFKSAPRPSASSFPKDATKLSSNLNSIDLNARRKEAAQEASRLKEAQAKLEQDFETEESGSGSEDESGSGSEDDSSEEESSSEDDSRRKLLRPVFLNKNARKAVQERRPEIDAKTEDEKWAEEESKRKERADAMLKEQLEKQAQARAEGKAFWDDEKVEDDIDDRDGLDPEAERTAWKLRELKRVKRERDALIAAEKEREEIERRRNLTAEEREAEDREYLAKQKEERDGKGKMGFMQKYFHKGAFYVEDAKDAGLLDRDVMGGRYQDDVLDRSALPEFMQIRDMTKLGKKGRTRYRDMRSEDTGSFGDYGRGQRKPRDGDFRGVDDRFQPDSHGDPGATGANASALGERKRPGDDYHREEKRPRVN